MQVEIISIKIWTQLVYTAQSMFNISLLIVEQKYRNDLQLNENVILMLVCVFFLFSDNKI